jgi:hypothetical protein
MLPIYGMAISGIIFVLCAAWWLTNNYRATMAMQQALDRYVLPRHLTADQIATIGRYLKQYDPLRYNMKILANSTEASAYAQDIRTALEDGGWRAVYIEQVPNLPEGITYYRERSSDAARVPGTHGSRQLFIDALKAAKVRVEGGGGSSASGRAPEIELTVIVGARSMSDADDILRRQMQEELKEQEQLR